MILDFNNLTTEETKRLNMIYESMMKSYTEFVDEYSKVYGGNYLFWATPFASRNVFHDNTMYRIVKIILALELVEKGTVDKIITETQSEYRVLKKNLKKSVELESREKYSIIKKIVASINCFLYLLRFCKDKIMYLWFLGSAKIEYPSKMSVVADFAVSSYFENYIYNDRYMPHISEYHKDVYFLPVIIYNSRIRNRKLMDQIRNCKNHKFIIGNGFLKYVDLVEICRYLRFVNKMKKSKYYYDGLDVSDIVKRELYYGVTNRSVLDGLMMRKIIQRIAEKGLSIENFIMWYEGQPADVLMCTTVREVFPNANAVGYEGFPLIETLLSLFVSDYQYRTSHCPKKIAVPGLSFADMARQFCENIPVICVPILRNDYSILLKRKKNYARNILVVLPIFRDVSRELLNMVDKYVKNNGYCHVFVKNHPINADFSLKEYGIEELSFQPEFVIGTLESCLVGIDVVVGSSTTSSMEILFAGVPLVILCPYGKICFTALPTVLRNRLCHISYGYAEFEKSLNLCFSNPEIDNEIMNNVLIKKSTEAIGQLFVN